ncbi:hypothetical protein ACOSQ3_021765 [Xanthoceras sorbifolium]
MQPNNSKAPDPSPPNNTSQLTREATSSSRSPPISSDHSPPRKGKERNNGEGESTSPELTQPPLTSKGRRRTREGDEPLDESLSSQRRIGCPKRRLLLHPIFSEKKREEKKKNTNSLSI